GFPVACTVYVYVPAAVPGSVFPPPPPVVLELPQPARPPSAAISTSTPSICRQLRRLAGIPISISTASTAPVPAPAQPFFRICGYFMDATGAVVVTLNVTVP